MSGREPASGETRPGPFAGKAALVIDDDEFVRAVMVKTLEQLDCGNVISAVNGQQAIKKLRQLESDVDLILCDLEMPKVDGIETLRLLSNIQTKAGILIVSSHNEQVLRAAQELAHGYGLRLLGSVKKPISRSDIESVAPMLNLKKSTGYSPVDYAVTEDDLMRAIEQDELVAFYQPKARTADRSVVGLEALVRWNHPEHGLIGPGAFIPLAEQTQQIRPLTEWVLERALTECAPLFKSTTLKSVSVNVSVNALEDLSMPQRFESAVKNNGLSKENLVLEVTETGLMEDVRTSLNILSRLTIKGFKLSIDDFGTGYSSLQQLLRIPFNELKLDRSFVDGAAESKVQRIILESTVDMAHRLDLNVVAEGAETQTDFDIIEACGVEVIQGYFIQKPLPMSDLQDWLSDIKAVSG